MPGAQAPTGAVNPDRIRRQAVVVVHGQGEQRPMGTIRSFVEALWTFDKTLKLKDPDLGDPEKGNRTWIVPDDKGGLFDIQRITCPSLELDERRTDFFELYYADLFNTTPMRTLWRWLQRLIWVDPRHVTAEMRVPWGVFWVLSLVAVILFGAASYFSFRLPSDILERVMEDAWFVPAATLIGLMGLLLILPRFMLLLPAIIADPIASWRDRVGFALADVPAMVPYFGVLIAVTMLLHSYPAYWFILALGLELYLASTFLLPYFGDAASYLSAHTETVEMRQNVRQRGLALLRQLHDDNDYDRVVIISHSLGTVLAYDLLHILWEEVGPTKDNPPGEDAQAALDAVDRFVASHTGDDWSDTEVRDYQDLQWILFDELRRQKSGAADGIGVEAGWKISDFITLGSPLTSAQFLVAEGPADFARLKVDRLMPTSPAQPYDDDHQASYLDSKQRKVAHHGAVFSAVRWTNIYDPFPWMFLYGDAIGGKVSGADRFGAGIADLKQMICKMERLEPGRRADGTRFMYHECMWPVVSRFFTHNHYWTNTSGNWSHPSAHLVALRNAVGIDRRGQTKTPPRRAAQ